MTQREQASDDAIRAAQNELVLRDLNERLRLQPASRSRRLWEWVCECADITCMKAIALSIEEYDAVRAATTRFAVAPEAEHVNLDIERVVQREDRYWVVEKIGVGAAISETFDPRS
jgi:hypothetical protein